jgi:alkylation response protein AidB-like acyl-CoA dehydrogenase
MPSYVAPNKDFQFLIDHFLDLDQHADVPGIAEGRELAPALLDESAKLCQDVLQPLNVVGDQQGLRMEDGKVIMPDGFKEAYQMYVEGGWSTLTWPTEYGGQDMPEFVNMPLLEMVCSANLSFGLTPGLNHGAISLLLLHASDELKQTYLPKMVTGEWTGVMCLTEPSAGTDLGLVKSRATPNDDGTYSIEGSKIWISSGEHDMNENIIHLVLAKLPDAPEGSKGISLFLCPKYFVNEDGSLGERNHFSCASTEHKMGIHASPSCAMNYDGAKGWLVGKPHDGLKAMFTMMNAARLYVGVQGLGIGEVAYQNALAYTKERLQGRALTGAKNPEKPADPITVHPDVRRMLYSMKAFTEGGRALTMWTALQLDISHRHPDPEKRQEADDLVQLLTPIVKAHLTDGGFETASTAMQCLGGYGYCEEYGMSQFLRDSRIAMIYEGTNGIQSMDLVGRKLGYDTGRYLSRFFHPVDAFIAENRDMPGMAEFTKPLYQHTKYLQQATMWIGSMGLANPNHAGAGAVEYLRMFALVVYGYIWAKQAKIALEKRDQDPEFYDAKLATARFFMKKVLPQTTSLLASITAGADCVMDEAGF